MTRVLLVVAICLLSTSRVTVQCAEIPSEVTQAWDEYAASMKDIRANIVETRRFIGTPALPIYKDTIRTFSLKSSGEWNSLELTSMNSSKRRQLDVVNPKYAFTLVKDEATIGKEWYLSRIDKSRMVTIEHINGYIPPLLLKPISIVAVDLRRLTNLNSFELVAFEKSSTDPPGSNLYRMEFTLNPESASNESIRSGTVYLDASKKWFVSRYVADCTWENGDQTKVEGTYTYADASPNPVIVNVNERYHQKVGGYCDWALKYELMEIAKIPEEEFFLSYYGFPEPGFGDWGPYIRPGGILIIIAASLVIAGSILKRRNAAQ